MKQYRFDYIKEMVDEWREDIPKTKQTIMGTPFLISSPILEFDEGGKPRCIPAIDKYGEKIDDINEWFEQREKYCENLAREYKKNKNIKTLNNMNDILVLIDCQNDFISGSLKNDEAIKTVPNIVAKIKNFKGNTILVTKDTHFSDYLSTKEGRKLPIAHCVKGTEGWRLNSDIKKALDDVIVAGKTVKFIEKNTFGSLNLITELRYALRDLEWENYVTSKIEFVGFCTDICVVSNVLLAKAEFYDTNIVIDASCCAGVTPESHKAAITTMKMCQVDIINE